MTNDVKQLIWIVLIIGILGYIYYTHSKESFSMLRNPLYDVSKQKRDSFMIYGSNNKSQPKLTYDSNENQFKIN